MPLIVPTLDNRRYQDLRNEALARIPVYTPEWTNFNRSDPGVTIVEVMSFLVETLLYRSNQIPDRMRRKFLTLLDIPLQEGTAAKGLVTFNNERGPLQTFTLNSDLEVTAGQVPFRTLQGLDVLPVTAYLYVKQTLSEADQPAEIKDYYNQLYAAQTNQNAPSDLVLYQTTRYITRPNSDSAVDLSQTVDNSLWIALITRDKNEDIEEVRTQLAGKILSLGIVPALDETQAQLSLTTGSAQDGSALQFQIPDTRPDGSLLDSTDRKASYKDLNVRAPVNVLREPGIVEITLPDKDHLNIWQDLEPLEAGTGDFPPSLDDTDFGNPNRVVTWLRIVVPKGVQARLYWVGINAVPVTQRARVNNEVLPGGTSEPDQIVRLTHTPIIAPSLRVTITPPQEPAKVWQQIDDLSAAGPEVPVTDIRQPPGVKAMPNTQVDVYWLNPESGEIRFGDGTRGRRPPFGASIRADYDYSVGQAGNVGPDAINASAALPAGIKVSNPVHTYGGTDKETVDEGEKQISRYLRHRDRLVSAEDFATITWRTPGVQIGRVDVLPAFNPDPAYAPNEPGNAPGAVTLMVIPRDDSDHPDAPEPDTAFLDAICAYLEPRRLVTTEVFLRGPSYVDIYVGIAIKVTPGVSTAPVREAVKQELTTFLSSLPPATSVGMPTEPNAPRGWPLRKSVVDLELLAVASRVPNVLYVTAVVIAQGTSDPTSQIPFTNLQLPRLAGISVEIGDGQTALEALRRLRGTKATVSSSSTSNIKPIPVIPEECD